MKSLLTINDFSENNFSRTFEQRPAKLAETFCVHIEKSSEKM